MLSSLFFGLSQSLYRFSITFLRGVPAVCKSYNMAAAFFGSGCLRQMVSTHQVHKHTKKTPVSNCFISEVIQSFSPPRDEIFPNFIFDTCDIILVTNDQAGELK